jgi:hypothetical protein
LDIAHNTAMNSPRRFPLQIVAGILLLAIGYMGGRYHAPKEHASLAAVVGVAMRETTPSDSQAIVPIVGSPAGSGGD